MNFLIPIQGIEMGIYKCEVRGSLVVVSHFGVKRGGAVGPQLPRVLLVWISLPRVAQKRALLA